MCVCVYVCMYIYRVPPERSYFFGNLDYYVQQYSNNSWLYSISFVYLFENFLYWFIRIEKQNYISITERRFKLIFHQIEIKIQFINEVYSLHLKIPIINYIK